MANRHQARESALEVLYAWHSAERDEGMIPDLLNSRLQLEERRAQDQQYLREAVYGVLGEIDEIDQLIAGAIRGRSLRSVAHVEINVLRLAVWEMRNRLEIPYRVIINEAVELTRAYAGEAPRGFINAVLDNLARKLRTEEVAKAARKGAR
ncbi:MAG: transcription antitermination factor NusB [Zetaproteobacteria bacterium]|nr:MAG: transcription antitermination factor NusB [Zetaproteobacteria bacterium]